MSKEPKTPIAEVDTETTRIENTLAKYLVIKIKKHWAMLLAVLALGYNPIKDVIATQYPMRGEEKVDSFRVKTTQDNHELLQQVAAGFTSISNTSLSLEAKVDRLQGNVDAVKQQVTDIKESVKNIDGRVDMLFMNGKK